jgi:hypothetical protein|tara:strand:- start:242 stop:685 length:444 start_codon:yes stop_codon:yes gene_type:complete
MGTSFYVYENLAEFEKLYKHTMEEEMYCIKITDMYIKPNDVLWIVEKYDKIKEKPLLGRSIVHFRDSSFEKNKQGDEILVLHEKVKFDPKRMKVQFFPKILRKPLFELKCDRFYGNENMKKGKKIDYAHRYYDINADRVNLVLKDEN